MISFWQAGVRRGAVIALLGAALLGCFNTQNPPTETNVEAKAEAPNLANAEEFTMEGKPTKTIETPWGPRVIYDPAQDVEVISAFKKIYEQGNIIVSEKSLDFEKSDEAIVYQARELKTHSIMEAGCHFQSVIECGKYYKITNFERFYRGEESEVTEYSTINVSRPSVCDLGPSSQHYPISSTRTGPIYDSENNPIVESLSLSEAMEWFFTSKCTKWSPQRNRRIRRK